MTLFKPNLKEIKDGLNLDDDLQDNQSVIDGAQLLHDIFDCRYILTTMSDNCVLMSLKVRTEERNIFIPAHIRMISNVSGAGDTVISLASLCLAMNRSPNEIALYFEPGRRSCLRRGRRCYPSTRKNG